MCDQTFLNNIFQYSLTFRSPRFCDIMFIRKQNLLLIAKLVEKFHTIFSINIKSYSMDAKSRINKDRLTINSEVLITASCAMGNALITDIRTPSQKQIFFVRTTTSYSCAYVCCRLQILSVARVQSQGHRLVILFLM